MISLFKDRTPVNLLFVFLLSILVKAPLFLYPHDVVATQNGGDLYHLFVQGIHSFTNLKILFSVAAFLLLVVQAFIINYIVNEYRLLPKATFLPAMAYLLITSLLPEWNFFSPALVANTFIIWSLSLLFKLYNVQDSKGKIFNMGLLIGVSSFIYFPSAAFLLCLLLGILILKPFRFNEIILFFLGLIAPYYFFAGYLFLTDQFTRENLIPNFSVNVPTVKSNIYLAITTFLIAVPFLTGGFFVQGQLHRMLIQVRKNWSIFLLYLILAFFIPFINNSSTFSNWILVAVPFAVFHAAAYFYPKTNWFPVIIFLLTLSFILFQQYGTPLWRQASNFTI